MRYDPVIRALALVLAVVSLAAAGLCVILHQWDRNLTASGKPEDQWVEEQVEAFAQEQMQLVADQYAQTMYGSGMTGTIFLDFVDTGDYVNRKEVNDVFSDGGFRLPYFTKWSTPVGISFLVRYAGTGKVLGSVPHSSGSRTWIGEDLTGTYYTKISVLDLKPLEHTVASKGSERLVRRTQDHISVTLEISSSAYSRLVESFTPAPTVLVRFLGIVGPWLLWALAGCGVLFLLSTALLLSGAGYDRKRVLALRGLNRLPLDVYLLAAVAAVLQCIRILKDFLFAFQETGSAVLLFGVPIGLALGAAVLPVLWLLAAAAQLKGERWAWLRRCLLARLAVYLARVLPGVIRAAARWLGDLFNMLPIVYQWFLVGALMIGGLFLGIRGLYFNRNYLSLALSLAAAALIIGYAAWAFGRLARGVEHMRQGELSDQIDVRFLPPGFRQCGENINALADAAMVAAQEQMKSERMKTELITNVSHDIKTPLTSIMSYAQLLREPHTPEQEAEYLEVMTRQTMRMKKLVEDLVDMSKATTGNVEVSLTSLDAVEAMNQALGEFTDRFEAAGLRLVYAPPHEPVTILADGKLLWRVLSNLLVNVVKYALEGTRVYADIAREAGQTVISLKNISRDLLNISSDELMERFVRGDASRNTEGSGLGLNIAQSLMELQNGQLRLSVDGDLFKASMIFPDP